jgi:hypothetical protein
MILRLKSTVLSIGIIAESWDFNIKQSVEFQYVLIIKVYTETYIMICAACNGFSLQAVSLLQIHVSTSNIIRCIHLYIPIQINFVYMPVVKEVYNLLICTIVLNFNFLSLRHFTLLYSCFVFYEESTL